MKASVIQAFILLVGIYVWEVNAKPNPTDEVMDEVIDALPEANNELDTPKERGGKYTDNSHCLVE